MKVSAKYIFCMVVASAPSGFQHGYNISYFTSIKDILVSWIYDLNLPGLETGREIEILFVFISAIICVGGMLGGALVGVIGNNLGRKGGLMLNDVIGIGAAALAMFTKLGKSPYILLVARFLIGINCGLNAGLSPMYLNESSPVKIRGSIGILYQLFIVISILVAQVLSLSYVFGTHPLWIFLFIINIATCALQFGLFFLLPETPKYVLQKTKDEEKSTRALQKLHGKKVDISDFLNDIKTDIAASEELPKVSLKEFFSKKVYVKPLLLGVFLMFAQQFSGINAVIFYSSQIFETSHLSHSSAELATIGVGLVNLAATILSIWLIERLGRKPLLLLCFGGMLGFTVILTIFLFLSDHYRWAGYSCIAWVYGFIFFFAIGAGPVPWVSMTELFYTSARPIALSIIVPSNWFFNFLVVLIFPMVMGEIGYFVFFIFMACQIVSIIIIAVFLPETKGKTIEEITTSLKT